MEHWVRLRQRSISIGTLSMLRAEAVEVASRKACDEVAGAAVDEASSSNRVA